MSCTIKSSSILIETDSGVNLTLRRVPRNRLAKFGEKYDDLMEGLLRENGAMGSFLASDKNYKILKDLCALIPIDEEPKTLELEKIEDDYSLLTRLFFSNSWDEETLSFKNLKEESTFEAAIICKFNFIEYEERLVKIMTKVIADKSALQQANQTKA